MLLTATIFAKLLLTKKMLSLDLGAWGFQNSVFILYKSMSKLYLQVKQDKAGPTPYFGCA